MSAGDAVKLNIGGSLCYRARGGRKGADFGENVNELTSFFKKFSHSRPYIKDITREDLISSRHRVSSIPDNKITELVDNAAMYKTVAGGLDPKTGKYSFSFTHTETQGIKNPEYLKETLINRKNHISEFEQLCINTPQKTNETIEEYIARIDLLMKKKTYNSF